MAAWAPRRRCAWRYLPISTCVTGAPVCSIRPGADLNGLGPLVRDEDVAVVGYRVVGDNDRFGGEDIRSTAIGVLDLQEVRRLGTGPPLSG